MQEQIFFNKILRNISKIGTHWIPHTNIRHKIRDSLFKKMNASFNRVLISKYRKQYCDELMYVDIAISLGEACKSAYHLQQFGLRRFASPFDWMMCYDLKDIQNLFANDFSGFFVDIEEKQDYNSENGCRYITDLRNGMVSIHAFKQDKSIESQYDLFIETMQRRFLKLKSHILRSKHIMFVTSRPSDICACEKFLRFMQGYHDANYTILNITNNERGNSFELAKNTIIFSTKLRLIEYSFADFFPLFDYQSATEVGGGGEAEHRDSIKNLQKCDAIKNNPTNTAQSLNTKQSSLRLIEQYKSSKIKDIIIKRGKQAYEIYLKIPLFCIPIINKYISYPVRLDLMYSAHGKWVGNFMQWSKIMLLIVLNEIDFKNFNITDIQRPDSTKDSYSESPIMFDDEFLHQE